MYNNYSYSNSTITDTPCHYCKNRVMNCHSSCESYNNWKNKHEIKTKQIQEEKNFEYIVEGKINKRA